MLKPLLEATDRGAVKGRAHYLLALSEPLKRSVTSRWLRDKRTWSQGDGLIRVAPGTQAALGAHRLRQRAYSLSALQRFATCPYQFLLATVYRLEPWDEPEPLVRMDPLTRGSLFHTAQAEFYRRVWGRGAAGSEIPLRILRGDAVREVKVRSIDRVKYFRQKTSY